MKTLRALSCLFLFTFFSGLVFGQNPASGPTALPSAKVAKEMREKQEAAKTQLTASEKKVAEAQKALDDAKKQVADDTYKLTKATADAKAADEVAQKDLRDLLATIEASKKLLENVPVAPVVGKTVPPKITPPVVAPIEPATVEEDKNPKDPPKLDPKKEPMAKSNVKQTTLPQLPPDVTIPVSKEPADLITRQEVPKLKATPFVVGKKSVYETEDKDKEKEAPPAKALEKKTGSIVVVTSPSATVTIDGVNTATAGNRRSFVTPELEVGTAYTYTFRATHPGGRTVEKKVEITGGGSAEVSLE